MVEESQFVDYQILIRAFGSRVIQKHVNSISLEIDGVRTVKDIEFIHRARVASRRLRSALKLFAIYLPDRKGRSWTREIRGITQALGAARDLDVQAAYLRSYIQDMTDSKLKTGIRRLLLRLQQKRVVMQEQVVNSLDHLEKKGALKDIGEYFCDPIGDSIELQPYPSELYVLACQSLEKCLSDFLLYELYISDPEKKEELHLMRIAAKRLRYTQEIFAPLYNGQLQEFIEPTRRCQDILGEIHDLDVWQVSLPIFLEDEKLRVQQYCGSLRPWKTFIPGIDHFNQFILQKRQEKFSLFGAEWQKWISQDIWNNLVSTIRQPVQSKAIYPPISFPTQSESSAPTTG